jgi:protein phosphatase
VNPANNPGDTVEMEIPVAPKVMDAPAPYSTLVQVDLAGFSHAGKVRPNNEDHFLIVRFGRYLEPVATNLPVNDRPMVSEESGYGMVVADGIGGSAEGEVASKMAINTFINLVLRTPDWILRQDDDSSTQRALRRASERFREVNAALSEHAGADPNLRGFGTTMTMAMSVGSDLLIAHVGDSRAYLYRQGNLVQLTRDHTLAQAMADQGVLRQQEVNKNKFRHVLTRALGSDDDLQPDVDSLTLENGDTLILCTDGLTDMVPPPRIAMILAANESAQTTCYRLVDEALNAGGKDNVTAVVARYLLPAQVKDGASE